MSTGQQTNAMPRSHWPATALTARVAEVAQTVDAWGEARAWIGSDPYDSTNATRWVTPLLRTAKGRQVLAQVVKRSPLNVRPVLGIAPGLCSVTLANVVTAHSIGGFLDDDAHAARMRDALRRLKELRLDAYEEPAWGYYWDAQSRLLYYPRSEPNGIATAFVGHAFLDAYAKLGDSEWLELGLGAATWFFRRVPRTGGEGGTFFGYLAGDRTPIHNANLLACSLLARAGAHCDQDEWRTAAVEGVAYTLSHQRDDGGWLYGETPSSRWVDGFHTGYVLDALDICARSDLPIDIEPALIRGLDFYREALFLPDGTPKYFENATYPIDSESVAQGIQTFAIAALRNERFLADALRVFEYAMGRMYRGDGRFLFQRRRLWVNPQPHMRWTQSPMLRALAHLRAAVEIASS